ncbi:hypothetical protein [Streptomyces sp. CC208A]|uniref:hypothetical protein n=1 Tax=Streptomyces sp. CC208A TaxID=3044573 RepID=UPI0024A7EC84|nr:hypothetical protein [Streptomyces sp. CC208A]
MRRRHSAFLLPAGVALGLVGFLAPAAQAGSAHFVTVSASTSGNTLTVTGKEAGLGNLDQVRIEVTADAQCVNKGGNKPQADNKQSFGAGEDVPAQNGKANFSVTVTANLQPDCTKSMKLVWSNIVVTDVTNGVSTTL